MEELIDNYDDEYDKLDPQIAQAFVPESRIRLQSKVSITPKTDLKQQEKEKGILLAKGIYAKNGKKPYMVSWKRHKPVI